MLTRTQIETAAAEELKRLQVRIGAELEGRRETEERNHKSAVEVLKSHETPADTFQWQIRECEHKDRCNNCKSGNRHDPYPGERGPGTGSRRNLPLH